MKFKIDVLKKVKHADGSQTLAYRVYRKDKKQMTPAQLRLLADKMQNKLTPGSDYQLRAGTAVPSDTFIRALAPDKWSVLKNFGKDFQVLDEDEYLAGKVAQNTKYERYYQAQIIINKR